jgi:hypothetical protein
MLNFVLHLLFIYFSIGGGFGFAALSKDAALIVEGVTILKSPWLAFVVHAVGWPMLVYHRFA